MRKERWEREIGWETRETERFVSDSRVDARRGDPVLLALDNTTGALIAGLTLPAEHPDHESAERPKSLNSEGQCLLAWNAAPICRLLPMGLKISPRQRLMA
jgi:hypothetical protein